MNARHDTRNSTDRLVQMANDIANYFQSEPDREVAIDGMVQHMTRFWEPRMLRRIREYAAHGGAELGELALAAVTRLPPPAAP